MVGTIDCAIICVRTRFDLVRTQILPSVLAQGLFREVLVVGEFKFGTGYRYLHVPDVTKTTIDALMKRECAASVSTADYLLYLCDDHLLAWEWPTGWAATRSGWDILVPTRLTEAGGQLHRINGGLDPADPNAPYCGGHAGIYRREVLRARPWMTAPHDLFWDLGHSRQCLDAGFTIAGSERLAVVDIDPNPVEKARHFALGPTVAGSVTP